MLRLFFPRRLLFRKRESSPAFRHVLRTRRCFLISLRPYLGTCSIRCRKWRGRSYYLPKSFQTAASALGPRGRTRASFNAAYLGHRRSISYARFTAIPLSFPTTKINDRRANLSPSIVILGQLCLPSKSRKKMSLLYYVLQGNFRTRED